MSVFSDRLKELRGPESQASFAAAIGVNRVQYAKYESGKNAPSVDFLADVCRIHACSADWLLGLKGHGGSVSVNAGSGAAVAIGTGAKASATAAKKAAPAHDCSTCKYRKAYEDMMKAAARVKGL